MLHGHDILYFGPGPWAGLWRNRHQLLSRFADKNRVLYVEPKVDLLTVRQRWWSREWGPKRLYQELKQGRVSQVQQNLYIYHSPTYTPVSGRPPFDRLTEGWWASALKVTLRRLNFQRPIVWLSQPEMFSLLGRWDAALTIYHVVDEYLAYQGLSPEVAEWLSEQERRLLANVDLVIVVSPKLLEAKRPFNTNTYLVPNGVDANAYSRPATMPDDLRAIAAPRIIYAGLISARLDLELILNLAQRQPGWSFVLMGEVNPRGVERAIAALRKQPNVHFLGVKPATLVPDYIRGSQACLLPYRLVDETQFMDPLKLYEGLAAGKPIVATPVPAVNDLRDSLYVAGSTVEMETALQAALSENEPALTWQRMELAARHTWERRVAELSRLITQHLQPVANGQGTKDAPSASSVR